MKTVNSTSANWTLPKNEISGRHQCADPHHAEASRSLLGPDRGSRIAVRLRACASETLLIANSKNYAKTEQDINNRFISVTIPEGVWALVAAIRRHLVPRGAHRGLSVADLVIAATAIRLKLEVLHEDADYETVARFMPELKQRRLSVGPE